MKQVFVTGTDTDVGKTFVTAGLASALRKLGKNVGIMKPFAAGTPEKTGYKSYDVQILANAAQVNDAEELVNPYFFEMPASPFTATQSLGIEFNIKKVIDSFHQLTSIHDIILVEGIGGAMTPIMKDYFVTNLIKDLNLETILITSSRVGTVNHTVMTHKMCQNYGLKIAGIIINTLDPNGYEINVLKRDLKELTNVPIFGSIPYMADFNLENLSKIISNELSLESLFN